MTEVVSKTMHILDKVNDRLDIIQKLFSKDKGKICANPTGFTYDDSISVNTVYENKNMTVTHAFWLKEDIPYPEHCHECSVEYLIVTNGKFIFKCEAFSRIIKKGECISVPMGTKHTTISLVKNSELICICVPPEKAYLVENIGRSHV